MQQVREQHELDVSLREDERKQRHKAIVNTMDVMIGNAVGILNCVLSDLDDAVMKQTRFPGHKQALYQQALHDIESDLSSISIFDLPDAGMAKHFCEVRTALKQVSYLYSGLMQHQGHFDACLQLAFSPAATQALQFLETLRTEIGDYS